MDETTYQLREQLADLLLNLKLEHRPSVQKLIRAEIQQVRGYIREAMQPAIDRLQDTP